MQYGRHTYTLASQERVGQGRAGQKAHCTEKVKFQFVQLLMLNNYALTRLEGTANVR